MQLLRVSLPVFAFLGAEADVSPNWLAWKPHDNADAQSLINSYVTQLAVSKATSVSTGKHAPLVLKEGRNQLKKPPSVAHFSHKRVAVNPQLDRYLEGSHHLPAKGPHYSTQWTVAPRKDIDVQKVSIPSGPESGDAYLSELYGKPLPVAPAQGLDARKANSVVAPKLLSSQDAGVSVSKLIKGPLRDAVVEAEEMDAEYKGKKTQSTIGKVLAWGNPWASKAAPKIHVSDTQMTSHVADATLGNTEDNDYMRFLASRKDQVRMDARDAEQQASKVKTGNGYMGSILSDEDSLILEH